MTDFGSATKPITDRSEASFGSQDAYRQAIAETLDMACFHAELGIRYATVGDDFGLTYTIRRLATYLRAAIGTLADLQASKSREPRS
jgi:hypothetical protein